MKFLRRIFNPDSMGLDAIQFDTLGWPEIERKDNHIYWQSETYPAQLSLHYFPQAPDLISDLDNSGSLQKFYRKKITKQGGGIIQVERARIQGYFAIETLFKIPMKAGGFIYVGSYTFPFARHGFVVKVQAQEYQEVGIREKAVQEKLQASGQLLEEYGMSKDWEKDPYDKDYQLGARMNQAEEIKYDLFFPDHPLTRVREVMFRLRSSFLFDEGIAKLDPYPGT